MNIASKQQRTVKNDRIRESMSLYRNDFPVLNQIINGQKLVYLDSAASSQMPNQVIDEIARYQSNDHANVHRGIHTLSHRATNLFEETRKEISNFINSTHTNEIIFTSGTTESINLVAQSFCRPILNKNKKILITGASGGIGNELVKKFVALGGNVLGSGTKTEKLDKSTGC